MNKMTRMQKVLNAGYLSAIEALKRTFVTIAYDENLEPPKTKEEIVCEYLLDNGLLYVALSFLHGSCEHDGLKLCVLCGEKIPD